jgi:hypothetical protein
MAVNFSTDLYLIEQDTFGRPVTFTSKTGSSFSGQGRGIYDSDKLDFISENGTVVSDQQTILDIRAAEFPILPAQEDTINIPAEPITGLPALGDYEIIDLTDNGGGEVTLTLRKIVSAP